MRKWICGMLCFAMAAGMVSFDAEATTYNTESGTPDCEAVQEIKAVPSAAVPTKNPVPSAETATVETPSIGTAVPQPTTVPTPLPVFTGNKIVQDESVFVVSENSADKTCTIVGYNGDTGVTTLYIPKQIKKKTVKAVADGVLAKCPFLKNVVVLGDTEIMGADPFAAASGVEIWGKTGGKANALAAAKGLAFHAVEGPVSVSGKKASNLKRATISWGAVAGAVSYNVYRKQGSGKYALNKNVGAVTFTNEGLKPGAKYTYKVNPVFTASNGDKIEGLASKEILVAMVPAKVKKLKAKGIRGGIQVRWKRDRNVSGYQVFMKVHVKGFKTNFNRVKTVNRNKTTGYRCKMLVRGMKYSYRVRSYVKMGGKKIYGPYVTVSTRAK